MIPRYLTPTCPPTASPPHQLRNLWRSNVRNSRAQVHALAEQLCSLALPLLPECNAWGLSNMLHSISSLPANATLLRLAGALVARAQPQLANFTNQGLANTAWALATLRMNCSFTAPPVFLDALVAASKSQAHLFNAQGVSNLIWSLAKLQHYNKALMEALLTAAMPQLAEFDPQGLANMAWALATLGHKSPLFTDALLVASQPQLGSFNPQGLANTAWALATLDHR